MSQDTIHTIRQEQLEHLLAEHQGLQVELAKTLKRQPAQLSHWLNGRKRMSEDVARDIEKKAKKPAYWMDRRTEASRAHHSAHVAEEQPPYNAQPAGWPLPGITRHQLDRLNPSELDLVVGHIKLVLQQADASRPAGPSWREVALALAASADLQSPDQPDRFTQFCLAVDAQFAAGATPPPRSRRRGLPSPS